MEAYPMTTGKWPIYDSDRQTHLGPLSFQRRNPGIQDRRNVG